MKNMQDIWNKDIPDICEIIDFVAILMLRKKWPFYSSIF